MLLLDQAISDFHSRRRPSSLGGRIFGAIAQKIRSARLIFGDPLVTFEWCGRKMRLPLSHDLPRFARVFPDYNATLGRLAATMSQCLNRPVNAIDIGANVGDTAVLLLAHGAGTVLCVEGSPRFADLLRQNTSDLPQVLGTECLVAFTDAPKNVRISEAKGTGFVVESSNGNTVPVMNLEQILASHQRKPHEVDLVKIDTDGYDGAIIRHHEVFFRSVRPIIHFEYLFSAAGGMSSAINLPDEAALDSLAAAGYDRVIAYRNTGVPMIYAACEGAGPMLRRLYASGRLGVYADVAAFPATARVIADAAARDLGLHFSDS